MQRGLRRPQRGTSTSATSPTRCTCGVSPVRPVAAWCCGSRTTTGSARGPSSTLRCSRTSAGSGSSPTPARFASQTTGRCMRLRWRDSGMAGWSTPATAPARRSPRGRGRMGGRGRVAAVRAAAATATWRTALEPACGSPLDPARKHGTTYGSDHGATTPTAKATCSCAALPAERRPPRRRRQPLQDGGEVVLGEAADLRLGPQPEHGVRRQHERQHRAGEQLAHALDLVVLERQAALARPPGARSRR